jgi:hypothetical protein
MLLSFDRFPSVVHLQYMMSVADVKWIPFASTRSYFHQHALEALAANNVLCSAETLANCLNSLPNIGDLHVSAAHQVFHRIFDMNFGTEGIDLTALYSTCKGLIISLKACIDIHTYIKKNLHTE